MKRIVAILLFIITLFGCVSAEYVEIDDNDFGYIDISLRPRQVFLQWLKDPFYYGEKVSLVAILVNFLPSDTCTFIWEYSIDGNEWNKVNDCNWQICTFTANENTLNYYWRVEVISQEECLYGYNF